MPSRVTIKDVAAKARVSYQTVSKVLNRQAQVSKETETRIWNAVHELGYTRDQRAHNLRAQRSYMLGYSWAPTQEDQVNQVLDSFLQSIMAAAKAAGYHILLFPHPELKGHIAAYRELIHSGSVDGFVLSSVQHNDPRLSFLLNEQVPFVAFGRGQAAAAYAYVDVDGMAGMQAATEHLLEQGHRKIAVLAWHRTSRVGSDRLKGYTNVLRAAGIAHEPQWIVRGEGTVDFGYTAARAWLTLPEAKRPTAMIAMNDAMAIGAMRAAHEQGLQVGPEIGIIGFDDIPLSQYLTPPLTSVHQPIWEIGQKVISILVHLVENKPSPEFQILLPPRLIVRESSLGFVPNESQNPFSA